MCPCFGCGRPRCVNPRGGYHSHCGDTCRHAVCGGSHGAAAAAGGGGGRGSRAAPLSLSQVEARILELVDASVDGVLLGDLKRQYAEYFAAGPLDYKSFGCTKLRHLVGMLPSLEYHGCDETGQGYEYIARLA